MQPWRGLLCVVALLYAGTCRADALDQIRQRGVLRWGGDQEGGGPYIYPDPGDPRRVTGFEVDLMDRIARQLDVRSEFVQCEWTHLPDLLRKGDIDAIVNGYELTAAHQATKLATLPYYIYELQLVARRDDRSITSWDDLRAHHGRLRKVGVLQGSAAETYVRQRFGGDIAAVGYQGSTDAMQEVQNEKLDATVQDLPPAIFYRARYPGLHFVGAPVGRGYYVIYVRPGDDRLRDVLNGSLLGLMGSGHLRSIYERYGLWNDTQEDLVRAARSLDAVTLLASSPAAKLPAGLPWMALGRAAISPTNPVRAPDARVATDVRGWAVVRQDLPILLEAAWTTVQLTCISMPLAVMIGLLVALGRLYGPRPLRWLLAAYVEILRGTPLLLQLYTIFFVLPAAHVRIPAFEAAVLGIAINYSAYEAEIYRAGLLAIPVGQMEAALALGMSRLTALRRIIVPQAVRLVIPPVTNDFVALFKDTSICSVVTVVELTKRYEILANSTGAYLELAALTALLYLLMSCPLSFLARRLERRVPRAAA